MKLALFPPAVSEGFPAEVPLPSELLSGSEGQNLALTVLCVPYSLDSGSRIHCVNRRPGGDPGADRWFLESTPIQMLPPEGSICGRLTRDLPLGCLQGGCVVGKTSERSAAKRKGDNSNCIKDVYLKAEARILP